MQTKSKPESRAVIALRRRTAEKIGKIVARPGGPDNVSAIAAAVSTYYRKLARLTCRDDVTRMRSAR
jgi:hypothetical protein